jgi:uncharacterized protein YegP (UPF0339 family)
MNLYFEVYQSSNDYKYYWRLKEKSTSIYLSDTIIATGHQAYASRYDAKSDIELVKRAMPNTPVKDI